MTDTHPEAVSICTAVFTAVQQHLSGYRPGISQNTEMPIV